MKVIVAAIDIHKKVLMAVLADASQEELKFEQFRCGTTFQELELLRVWCKEHDVQEVVMESTAQYWKPVWLHLEPHFPSGRLHLAQAYSNRAPKGRKHDFGDAERLGRRFLSGELLLSYVPDAEQRSWRELTRMRVQRVRDRVRLGNQLEALLEEMGIKLSSVVSELLGKSGRRILEAIANGETDPVHLADLGDDRLRCGKAKLAEALKGRITKLHCQLLKLEMDRLASLDRDIETLQQLAAGVMSAHQDAVIRLAEVPGFGPQSAQQIIAEIGPAAKAFDSPAQLASWAGCCPGRSESAEQNYSSHSPKGNPFVRRILAEAAQGASRTKGSFWQRKFQQLVGKLGYQRAIWAIARKLCCLVWKILHQGVRYLEKGDPISPEAKKRRVRKLIQRLRQMGCEVTLQLPCQQPS